ncbi:nicotinamide-nucleotide amidohydrolase family protein [bacterium]|nr:nicotinamide-nucleotide amidohydrolase family protein [bacterium]
MTLFDADLIQRAQLVLDDAQARRLKIATAESCTGGLIAALLTEIPGSSATVERGFIVYSNRAKEEMLGVPGDMIADYGAVSEPVARAMAEGALRESRANLAIAVTGVAGPGGGSATKPVGLVHLAVARENKPIFHQAVRFGDIGRGEVRRQTVVTALDMITRML